MKIQKLLLILLASVFILSACKNLFNKGEDEGPATLPRELTANEKLLVEADHSFSYDIFSRIVETDSSDNIFISPLSVSMALGMTLNGADGETATGMRETLNLQGMDQQSINKAYSSLIELLASADPKVKMKLANSIWSRKGFAVQEKFIEDCKEFFNARIDSLDFSDPSAAETINQWVSENTEGLIEKIIDGEIPDDIVMYLINAIYFKGDWQYQFDPEKTTSKEFATKDGATEVDMMMQKGELAAYVSDEVQLLDLPYGDSLFTMTLMMPADKDTPITEFVQNDLTAENFDRWVSNLSTQETNIEVPKFELEYKITMNDVLAAMGMGQAFDPHNADFSNINPNVQLFIDEVKHKSFVKVDEKGTEAAAVTSVGIGTTSAGPKIRTIKFNRPYVFLIRERTSGAVLFMGKVNNPSK